MANLNVAAVGRHARALRGLLPLGHRPGDRHRPVDPLHDGGAARTAPPTCSLWFMAMDPAGDVRVGAQGLVPDRPSSSPSPSRSGCGRRQRADRPRDGAAASRTSRWDLRWEPEPRLRARPSAAAPREDRQDGARAAARRPRGRRHGDVAGGRELTLTARTAARRTCGAPSTRSRWAWAHCGDFADADGAPSQTLLRRRLRLRAALRARDRAEHAGRRALPRRGLRRHAPAGRRCAPRARSALTCWRFEAVAGKRRIVCEVDAPRRRSSASPTTTPTATRPTATTARRPRCASASSTRRGAGASLAAARDARSRRPRALRVRPARAGAGAGAAGRRDPAWSFNGALGRCSRRARAASARGRTPS